MEAYQASVGAVSARPLDPTRWVLWAKEGISIGSQTIRSWEAAIEYYKVSPDVCRFLSFPSFMQWARCGTYLAQDSPTLAVAFFKSSVAIVPNLQAAVHSLDGPGLGRSLYKGTWKSSTLAAKFFEVSPELVRSLPFWDVEVFASLIEALSYKSYDVASECLTLGKDVLPGMGREREPFLAMTRALIDTSWREVKTCLELVPRALQHVDEAQTGRFLKLGERLAKVGLRDTSRFLADGTQALGRVPQGNQGYILDLCDQLVAVAPEAVPPFLRSLDGVLNSHHGEPARYLVPARDAPASGESRKWHCLSSRSSPTPPSRCWKPSRPALSWIGSRASYACTAVQFRVLVWRS